MFTFVNLTCFIRCCEPSRFGVRIAVGECKDGRQLRAAVKFAMDCLCRPCFDVEPVALEEEPIYDMALLDKRMEVGLDGEMA